MPTDYKDPALERKLETYKENLKHNAEKLIFQVFPVKTLDLDSLVNGPQFSLQRIEEIINVDLNIPLPGELINGTHCTAPEEEQPAPAKKRARTEDGGKNKLEGTSVIGFTCGVVPSNPLLSPLISIVKPLLRDAVEHVNTVRMWILFLIPRIEDGNNFGVSIQEETLGEVRSVEGEAASFMDHISRYLLTRGRLVTRIAKYPHVEDYRKAIRDVDEKEFVNLRLVLLELRNHYSTLHDMISKNIDKLRKPRNSNAEHLY